MENWDRNEWQGKRKDQVEYSNTVTILTAILFILFLGIFGILSLF